MLDTHLQGRFFLESDKFTLADIVIGAYAKRWFGLDGVERPPLPNLGAVVFAHCDPFGLQEIRRLSAHVNHGGQRRAMPWSRAHVACRERVRRCYLRPRGNRRWLVDLYNRRMKNAKPAATAAHSSQSRENGESRRFRRRACSCARAGAHAWRVTRSGARPCRRVLPRTRREAHAASPQSARIAAQFGPRD